MSYNPISYIDLIGASGTINKVDLTSATTQRLHGYGIKFTAGGNLLCGQPVIYNYASGVVTAITAGALPSQHEYIGIALETVSSGAKVEIATQGLATARRDTTFLASSETVLLNNTTNGTTRTLTNDTSFFDSGAGAGGDYASNENYQIVFDAQVGYTADIVVNDIEFEALGSSGQYDRLGVQGSNDGVNFTNLSVSWLQKMATSTFPYSTSFAGSSFNSSGSINGYVFPTTTTRAILLGSGSIPGATINTGFRYIKFLFFSDGSSQLAGWDMTLQPNTPYSTNVETVTEGTTLYLDNSDYTKTTTDDTSQIIVGYCAYDDASNNSIFIRV